MQQRITLSILVIGTFTAGAVWVGIHLSAPSYPLSQSGNADTAAKLVTNQNSQSQSLATGDQSRRSKSSTATHGTVTPTLPRSTNGNQQTPSRPSRPDTSSNGTDQRVTGSTSAINTQANPLFLPEKSIGSLALTGAPTTNQPPPPAFAPIVYRGIDTGSNAVQRRRPITTAQPGVHSEADVPRGDEVVVISDATAVEGTRRFPAPDGVTDEDRLVELGERLATAPLDAKSDIEMRFATLQDEGERMQLLILANASGDEKLAQRMIAQGLLPKQPISIRVQALEFAFGRDPSVAEHYKNDANVHLRFSAQALLGMNPVPPDE